MNYRSITACLDPDESSKRLAEFAVSVAAQQEAHLTGLYLSYVPPAIYDLYGGLGPMIVEWDKQDEERRTSYEELLRRSAGLAGVNTDWVVCKDLSWRLAMAHTRTADLAIIGQKRPGYTDLSQGFYDSLVMKSGRPVLFLPYACNIPQAFDRVIVAWDGSREAARALADAMPFLHKARQVLVLSAMSGRNKDNELPDVGIGAYLARHDIEAELERDDNVSIDTAQWLLSRAATMGADLLVMGAYGHNRFGEMILGGVTRSVMREMTLPVLMSH
ncbi:MAG TPA: universal stress protein [Burkholderiaceae bacterium]